MPEARPHRHPSLVSELREILAKRWRQQLGDDIYRRYIKLRVKMLGAKVATHGTEERIEYASIESGKDQKLVYFHGFADSKENFYDNAQFLKSRFDLLIPDLPGFGRSSRKRHVTYDLAYYRNSLIKLLDDLGWKEFHLVGNSLGGAVAIVVALAIPERIKSLTLIDPAGIVLPELPSIYYEFLNGRILFQIHSPMQFDYFLHRTFHKPPVIPPLVYDHLYKEFSRRSLWNSKIMSDLLEGIQSMDDPRRSDVTLNNRLKDIKPPTLILWGDEDSFFPAETGYFVQSQIPNSKFYLLANLGHAPQIEDPYRISKLIRKFALEGKR